MGERPRRRALWTESQIQERRNSWVQWSEREDDCCYRCWSRMIRQRFRNIIRRKEWYGHMLCEPNIDGHRVAIFANRERSPRDRLGLWKIPHVSSCYGIRAANRPQISRIYLVQKIEGVRESRKMGFKTATLPISCHVPGKSNIADCLSRFVIRWRLRNVRHIYCWGHNFIGIFHKSDWLWIRRRFRVKRRSVSNSKDESLVQGRI